MGHFGARFSTVLVQVVREPLRDIAPLAGCTFVLAAWHSQVPNLVGFWGLMHGIYMGIWEEFSLNGIRGILRGFEKDLSGILIYFNGIGRFE